MTIDWIVCMFSADGAKYEKLWTSVGGLTILNQWGSLWFAFLPLFTIYLRLWDALKALMRSGSRHTCGRTVLSRQFLCSSQLAQSRGTSFCRTWFWIWEGLL